MVRDFGEELSKFILGDIIRKAGDVEKTIGCTNILKITRVGSAVPMQSASRVITRQIFARNVTVRSLSVTSVVNINRGVFRMGASNNIAQERNSIQILYSLQSKRR